MGLPDLDYVPRTGIRKFRILKKFMIYYLFDTIFFSMAAKMSRYGPDQEIRI
jgi:hypothetical protein